MSGQSSAYDVVLAKEIYWRSAVDQAVEDFAEHLRVAVSREDDRAVVLTICALAGGAPDDRDLREFLNHVLDLSIPAQIRAAEEYRPDDAETFSKS